MLTEVSGCATWNGNRELQSVPQTAPTEGNSFGSLLQNAIGQVNSAQQTAGGMQTAFENGSGDASLAEVMIATQKADLSFRAMTEVRNKLVTAYQDIMNMPV
jgi:flagellar hook-basal body complex protein FliE